MIKPAQSADAPDIERRGRKDDCRRELAARIAADIRSGKLSGKLPGVTRLAVTYGACPATVQAGAATPGKRRARGNPALQRDLCPSAAGGRFVNFYLRDIQPHNMPDALDNMLANYGQLFQGLYDTLKPAGVPLSFQTLELGNRELLRRWNHRNRHLVAVLPAGQESLCYDLFAECRWTRVMGVQDYNCPTTHITYDNAGSERLRHGLCRNGDVVVSYSSAAETIRCSGRGLKRSDRLWHCTDSPPITST